MSAAGDREARPLVIAPAWDQLEALAVAMRAPDARRGWSADDVQRAILAARTAGVPFEDAAPVLWRALWDAYGEACELRDKAARTGGRQPFYGPEVNAAGKARVLAAIEAAHNDQPPQPPQ